MKILAAKNIGFCFGVKRAINLTLKALRENPGKPIYTFGPLIHNPPVIKELESKGIIAINCLKNIQNGILIIPSHGLSPSIIEEARKKNLFIIDATCPYVLKSQRLALELATQGYKVIVIGKNSHPEIRGIIGRIKKKGKVIYEAGDLKSICGNKKIGVIVQTTESLSRFREIVSLLTGKSFELKVYNTLCAHTLKRQQEALGVSKRTELMLVIGGHNSANTRRLFEICKQSVDTYQIESPDELNPRWFKKKKNIGIVSGTSTPLFAVKKIINKLRSERWIQG